MARTIRENTNALLNRENGGNSRAAYNVEAVAGNGEDRKDAATACARSQLLNIIVVNM
jgi:hypothetical protein